MDDSIKGAIMHNTLADISEKLAAAEERISLAKQAAGFGIWDWDMETDELIWDEQMLQMFQPKENTRTVQMFYDSVHPNDLSKVKDAMAASFTGAPYDYRFRVILSNGDIRHIRGKGSVIKRNAYGEPTRMTGVCFLAGT